MAFDQFMRKAVLTVADNRAVSSFIKKYGMQMGAKRFIAGEMLHESIENVKRLNKDGLVATLDHVGEFVANKQEAIEAADEACSIFKAIADAGVTSNVSVKLTQFGLNLDKDLCFENMDRIAAEAKKYNNFVRIDMEDSPVTQVTIDIFKKLLEKYGKEHIGLVVQTYLYRTEQDVIELGKLGANLRIVKGAYKEPAEVAFQDKAKVDENYIKMVKLHLTNGNYTAIATHDHNIINEIKKFVKENNIPNSLFEFQMLYGVRDQYQRELSKEGYKLRVYTPYGIDWYGYFTRRIAERPSNAFFVLRAMISKK